MTSSHTDDLGEQIRRYRRRAGLSQVQLATRAGLATAAVSALERGTRAHPYPTTLRMLAEALNLSREEQAGLAAAAAGTTNAERAAAPTLAVQLVGPPVPPTPLLGRADDVDALVGLLRAPVPRLLTLTGVGGGGKSRLAIAVAEAAQDAFPDGVCWVDLASVPDGALVGQAIAAALGVHEIPGTPILETVRAVLEPRRLLVILDNCEHLILDCARVAADLLATCPTVRLFATSREPLQIPGEQQWHVGSLTVPDANPEQPQALDDLIWSPAVQLFVARAQAVAPGFRITATNAPAIVDVCHRLDGIPLALELAAVQIRALSAEQLARRLDDAFSVLTRGSRTAPPRHQTLRATLDWSFALLDAEERVVFSRLSVCAGGCDVEAAEAICTPDDRDAAGDASTPPESIFEVLRRLIDKSLVVPIHGEQVVRYRLLEPIRQYAEQHLRAANDEEATRRRHLEQYLGLAERAAGELRGPAQVVWLAALDQDWPNLRAALRYAASQHDTVTVARLGCALVPFWEVRGYLSDGRRWLGEALAGCQPGDASASAGDTPALTTDLRVRVLIGAGRLAQWQADFAHADRLLEDAVSLARTLGDRTLLAEALTWLGTARRRQGAFDDAERLLAESLTLHEALGNLGGAAWALCNLGAVAGNIAELNEDAMRHDEAPRWVSLLEESVERFRDLGDVRFMAIASTMLGANLRSLRDRERQAILIHEGLAGFQLVGDRASLLGSLLSLAEQAARSGPPVCAARLLGAAEALRNSLGASLAHVNRVSYETALRNIQARLGDDELAAALAEGRTMSLDDVLAEAREGMRLSASQDPQIRAPVPDCGQPPVSLTTWRPREASG